MEEEEGVVCMICVAQCGTVDDMIRVMSKLRYYSVGAVLTTLLTRLIL